MWSLSFPSDAAEWARVNGVCIPHWLQFNIRGWKSPKDTSVKPQRVQIDSNRCTEKAYEFCFVYALVAFGAATGIAAVYAAQEPDNHMFIPMFPRYIEGIGAVDYRRTATVLWMRTQLNSLFENKVLRERFAAIGVPRQLRPHSLKSVAMIWALRSKLEWPQAKMNCRFIGSNDGHADKYAQRAQASLVRDAQGRQQDPLFSFWRMTYHVLTHDVVRSVPAGVDMSDDEDELDPAPARVRAVRPRLAPRPETVSESDDSEAVSESDDSEADLAHGDISDGE